MWKLETLSDLYETLTITQAVIFLNTRRKVDWLTEKMHQKDFTVSSMVSEWWSYFLSSLLFYSQFKAVVESAYVVKNSIVKIKKQTCLKELLGLFRLTICNFSVSYFVIVILRFV